MNLPNYLSFLRIVLVPVLVILLSLASDAAWWAALVVFLVASLTDYLDGQIARKNNLVTDLGRFLDPLADKLLVLSTMIMFAVRGLCPAYLPVVVLTRELAIDGLRMVASTKGIVIAAGKLGKIKTVSQMLYLIALFLLRIPALSHPALTAATWWVLAITFISGADYFRRNPGVLSDQA